MNPGAFGTLPSSACSLGTEGSLSRGFLRLRTASWDAAVADFDVALRIEPQEPHALYGRGLARLRKGDQAGSKRDFDAARRYSYDVDAQYADYGLKP